MPARPLHPPRCRPVATATLSSLRRSIPPDRGTAQPPANRPWVSPHTTNSWGAFSEQRRGLGAREVMKSHGDALPVRKGGTEGQSETPTPRFWGNVQTRVEFLKLHRVPEVLPEVGWTGKARRRCWGYREHDGSVCRGPGVTYGWKPVFFTNVTGNQKGGREGGLAPMPAPTKEESVGFSAGWEPKQPTASGQMCPTQRRGLPRIGWTKAGAGWVTEAVGWAKPGTEAGKVAPLGVEPGPGCGRVVSPSPPPMPQGGTGDARDWGGGAHPARSKAAPCSPGHPPPPSPRGNRCGQRRAAWARRLKGRA